MRTSRHFRPVALLTLAVLSLSACGKTPIATTAPSTLVPTSQSSTPTGSQSAPTAATTDVEMYKGDAARTGEVAGPGPAGKVAKVWSVATGGPVKSSPVVVGQTMYIVAGDRHVVSIDLSTGAIGWSSADGAYVGSPAVAQGTIVALGFDGSISGLSTSDGVVEWHTPASVHPNSSPLIVGDLVIAGGSDRVLRAFDLTDGKERWTLPSDGAMTRSAAEAGGTVFIGGEDGVFHAVAADSGKVAWTATLSADHFATPAIRDGVVFVASSKSDAPSVLTAFDVKTGTVRWRLVSPDEGFRSPSVDDSAVYVAGASHLYAVSPRNGSIAWSTDLTVSEAAIAIAGGRLYMFGDDQNAYAIDARSGNEVWHLPIGSGVAAGTTVVADRVLAGTDSGQIIAIGPTELAVASAAASATPVPSIKPAAAPAVVDSFSGAPGGLDWPVDVAVDPTGRAWVVEAGKDDIAIFDANGQFVERWGTVGSAKGQLMFHRVKAPTQPVGAIAFDAKGGFYVVDSGNSRVQHFDSKRTFLGSLGLFGSGDGRFLDPVGISIGSDGALYVTDDVRNDVQVFKADGTFIRKIGEGGSGPGQLNNIGAPLVVGTTLYVADYDNARIAVFKTDGTFVTNITSAAMTQPLDLGLLPDGRVVASDGMARGHIVDPVTDQIVSTWAADGAVTNNGDAGLEVLKDGRVLFAQYAVGKVETLDLKTVLQ